MKKKVAFLSLISALTIGASLGFTACGDDGVSEHDHVWDSGTVTTEPTCYEEGVRTYSCTVDGCNQTKTAPVSTIAHKWNGGEVTTEPTCSAEGVKTYTCTVDGCGKTKEEAVDKTDHRYDNGKITRTPDFLTGGKKTYTCEVCQDEKTGSVEARADFSEQFYTATEGQNNWYYGYMTSFGEQTGADDFVQMEQIEGGVWKAGEIKVGKGYVFGDNAAIAYRFEQALPEKMQTNVSVSFSGEESTTRLDAYLIINGDVKATVTENAKDWSFNTKDAIDVAQGDTFCIVFKNAGAGKAGGNLSITFTAPCIHIWDNGTVTKEATCTEAGVIQYSCSNCNKKITEYTEKGSHKYDNGTVTVAPTETGNGEKTFECLNCGDTRKETVIKLGANYSDDFSTEVNNGWEYGYTSDYDFGSNKFTFNALNPNNSTGAWVDNGGGIEIKSDWLKNETGGSNAVVRYNVQTTREVYISVSFDGSDATTRMTGRLNIIKADGSVQLCEFLDGTKSSAWSYNAKVTVEEGSSVSVLFFNESEGWNHGKFTMTISSQCIHSWDEGEVTTEPKCDADGVRTLTCEKCGETTTVPVTQRPDHDFTGGWITDSDEGHYHKCENCVATDKPVGHSWESKGVITYPTYEEEGEEAVECSVCHRTSTRKIPASNHVQSDEYGKDDDNHWFICSEHEDCGEKFEEGPHKYTTELTEQGQAATCLEDGYSVWQCVCGKTEQRSIPKSPDYHDLGNWQVDETAGTHYKECATCHEHMDVAEHSSDNPTTNTKPTLYANGSLVFDCDVCGTHIDKVLPARADFRDDFTAENQNGAWKYGYVNYSWGDDTFEFIAAGTFEDGAWKADGVQIKKGWIDAGAMTTIAYKVSDDITEDITVKAAITLVGGTDGTRLDLRIGIKNSEGVLYANPVFHNNPANNKLNIWGTYKLKAGDTIYFIFSNGANQEGCWPNGDLDITITPVYSFFDEFSTEGGNGWVYGYESDYQWEGEHKNNFTFTGLDAVSADEWGGKSGVIIKRDWILSEWTAENDGNANAAIGFEVPEGKTKLDVAVKFVHSPNSETEGVSPTRFSLRILVVGADGNTKSVEYRNADASSWEVTHTVDVADGDTVYFVLFREVGDWAQGKIQIAIDKN